VKKQRTESECLAAIQKDPYSFTSMSPEERTYNVTVAALKSKGVFLKFIPQTHEHYQDYCLVAVSSCGQIIQDIPMARRTPEIYLAAIYNNPNIITSFAPQERTPAVCHAAVARDSYILQHLTPQERTADICVTAILKEPAVIDFLNKEERAYVLPFVQAAQKSTEDNII